MKRVIFHIDVNSAFLSWTAAYRVQVLGETLDLRTVPSVIVGDQSKRHSIVLAKSHPAKQFQIHTGEPLFLAKQKCPDLKIAAPDYGLYVEASRHFIALLNHVSPVVEQYSIDEAWADFSGTQRLYGSPVAAAQALQRDIYEKLGFTVNIGISSNKLLSKLAGDFEKPNKIHTLFPEEIPAKLWPLPVRDLFQIGPATERKLRYMGITKIGQLAAADPQFLRRKLGKQGEVLWQFSHGYGMENLQAQPAENKGYSNAATLPFDIVDHQKAHQVLCSLCETVGMRLRRDGKTAGCIAVYLRTNRFQGSTHQMQLSGATASTQELYQAACRVFDEAWDASAPLRQLGVQVTKLDTQCYRQYDLFDGLRPEQWSRHEKIDAAVDGIREKYGENAILRARFLKSELPHMAGGLAKERRTGVTKPVPSL